jgi:hypothetical protein
MEVYMWYKTFVNWMWVVTMTATQWRTFMRELATLEDQGSTYSPLWTWL